jgi:hypothetical protein
MILRTDGFVSVQAPYSGGEMVTNLIRFVGNTLTINAATSAAGGISVEIQDADGKPVEGFALADAFEFVGDRIETEVQWKGGSDVGRLAGHPLRLRFVMKDADLYSLKFESRAP